MEIQGGSPSSLQATLISLASSAGTPYDASKNRAEHTEESHAKTGIGREMVLQEQLMRLSRELQEEMRRINTSIDFSYNDTIKGLVVTVKDGAGERIIREIPSEEAIELIRKMRDVIGNIFDERA